MKKIKILAKIFNSIGIKTLECLSFNLGDGQSVAICNHPFNKAAPIFFIDFNNHVRIKRW